jgi:hypothetical protein
MKIEGQWVPESNEELELMKQLHAAKVQAYDRGVSPEDIGAIFAYMASSSIAVPPKEGEQNGDQTSLQDVLERENKKAKNCPDCGEIIQDAVPLGIGGDFQLVPCGCSFDWDDRDKIGPWIEEPK